MRPPRQSFRRLAAAGLFLSLAPLLAGETDELRFLPSLHAALTTPSEATTPPPESPPPGAPSQPSLQDLGFTVEQQQGSVEAQERLDKRTRMLKIHQRLGLITLAPLIATVATAGGAKNHSGGNSQRNLHGALGLVTAAMYAWTASYAIRAPKIEGTETRGPIKWHKLLAWVHGVGMVLTPILGAMARNQLDNGERVHGVASAHSAVAAVTIGAYAAAIATVSIKF
jgi:hypothetical protein